VLTLRELRSAEEVFVTSSLRGVVPVTRLDATPRPRGPLTDRLARAYEAAMLVAPSRSDL
jgi:branched-subunit amino acid aminotransferase/4-amino-4-deoxychorismate lyase